MGLTAKNFVKRYFLPLGAIGAVIFGLSYPQLGKSVAGWGGNGFDPRTLAVIGIFFVIGLRLPHEQIRSHRGFWGAIAAVIIINLLVGPALATGISKILGLSGAILIGFLVVGASPTTLSSSTVITQTAGGNETWALSFVVLLNLAGILILPFSLGICLQSGGIVIERMPLFYKILRLVIIPLGIGLGAQKIWKRPSRSIYGYIPPFCVIFIIWVSICAESGRLVGMSWSGIGGILLLAAAFHLILLGCSFGAGRLLHLRPPEARAMGFVAAQKSLPISTSVLLLMEGGKNPGLLEAALITAILLYFPQILIDSTLAGQMRKHPSGK